MIRPVDQHERTKPAGHQEEERGQREPVERLPRKTHAGRSTSQDGPPKRRRAEHDTPEERSGEREGPATPRDGEQPEGFLGHSVDITA